MAKLKSERHHWWPKCVSQFWAAADGTTGWIKPDGSVKRIPPAQLGVIGNGHHVKLANPADPTPWDFSFEREFDAAEGNFPALIAWLESLDRQLLPGQVLSDRFLSQPANDEQLRWLTESVVSLAVRSPRNREASVGLAEKLRGPLPTWERNRLIGLNMRQSQRLIADSIGTGAKFAVVFSNGREFIYGDGFFHNVTAVVNPPLNPRILAPITSSVSVIICRPMSFLTQPRISTIVLTNEEVDKCNHAVQVHSRDTLFFRSETPTLDGAFTSGKHLVYADPDNPIDNLIAAIPGVPPRNTLPDTFLRKRMGRAAN